MYWFISFVLIVTICFNTSSISFSSSLQSVSIHTLFFLLIVVIIPKGDAILGDSSSYSVWSKFDSGATNNNATSSSFTNRFISGFQAVSQYVSSSFAGRWGILSSGNNLIINITYPTNNLKIIRGNDSVSG